MNSAKIEDIAFGGDGVARSSGKVIFIPFTAPGDVVQFSIEKQKKSWCRGKLEKILTPSPLRVFPLCSHYGICGGCQLQHIRYAAQLDIKRNFIEQALRRIGKVKEISVPPVVPSSLEWAYREHITLKVELLDEKLDIGYTSPTQMGFFAVQECPIFDPLAPPLFEKIRAFFSTLTKNLKGSLRVFKQNNHRYVLHFFIEEGFSEAVEKSITPFLENHPNIQGLALSTSQLEKEFGNTTLQKNMLGFSLYYSPRSFMQNHIEQAENIYRYLFDHLKPSSGKLLDLYCGTGITALLAIQEGFSHVLGIESSLSAVQLAQKNAKNNGMKNIDFIAAYAEEVIETSLKSFEAKAVLVNPPRTGLHPIVLKALLEFKPDLIGYISCMPATLARDVEPFLAEDYEIKAICGFDMFPQTTHVETVVILKKKQTRL